MKRDAGALSLRLSARATFPRTDAALRETLAALADHPRARFALQTLLRGYVRFEYFDTRERYLGSVERRVRVVDATGPLTIRLPALLRDEPARIVLLP